MFNSYFLAVILPVILHTKHKSPVQRGFLFAAVLGGCGAELFFENLGKVVHVQDANSGSHGGDAAVRGCQQHSGTINPLGVDVVHNGCAGILLEQA